MPERFVKQFNVYLPLDLIDEVKHYATETERSMSAIVEAALNDYLEAAWAPARRIPHLNAQPVATSRPPIVAKPLAFCLIRGSSKFCTRNRTSRRRSSANRNHLAARLSSAPPRDARLRPHAHRCR
jgi:hypothetical protein